MKLWLTVAVISFALFQIPLYYLNKATSDCPNCSYATLLWDFAKNWFCIMVLLAFSLLLVFRIVKKLYQPYWSARGFKLALLLVSEFMMLFVFVLYFCMFNSSYIVPTGYVIAVFLISDAIGVYLNKYNPLQKMFYQQHLDLE